MVMMRVMMMMVLVYVYVYVYVYKALACSQRYPSFNGDDDDNEADSKTTTTTNKTYCTGMRWDADADPEKVSSLHLYTISDDGQSSRNPFQKETILSWLWHSPLVSCIFFVKNIPPSKELKMNLCFELVYKPMN